MTKNTDAKPSLIEPPIDIKESKEPKKNETHRSRSTRYYKLTTNTSDEFYLYMKLSTKYKENCKTYKAKNKSDKKWKNCTFSFTDEEKTFLRNHMASGNKIFILLICSENDYNITDVAVITLKECLYILEQRKSITVKLEWVNSRYSDFLTLPIEEAPPLFIQRNRLDKKLTDIKDVV